MNTVGMPVTNQTQHARRVRHSQTVTPSSVSAASSWLLAPNRSQNSRHTGDGCVGRMPQQEEQRHARREADAEQSPAATLPAGQFLQ